MEAHGRPDHFSTTTSSSSSSFHTDGAGHHHQDDHFHGGHRHHHGEQTGGYHFFNPNNQSLPLSSGQKRQFPHPNSGDYGGFVKLYVVNVPRIATEQDISAVFGEHGQIVEVVLLRDKKTGLQQECCFVKYATLDQAERAIGAFNCQYTFPGAMIPMEVKFAVGERERLGSFGVQAHKLYVGGVNRQSLKLEIEEIFSSFGIVEEVYIVKDEFKQNKGCAFVQFSSRDMALAAIRALHGSYVMRGCDQPLIVRFADPKKPRVGDSRPGPYLNDFSNGHIMSNEMQQKKTILSGYKTAMMTSNGTAPTSHASQPASHAFNSIAEIEHSTECDWSEHVSPDGDLYYYNCVTCESRWDKPEEYARYEELDNLEEQVFSSPDVSEAHTL